jgi:hypothetical protein
MGRSSNGAAHFFVALNGVVSRNMNQQEEKFVTRFTEGF